MNSKESTEGQAARTSPSMVTISPSDRPLRNESRLVQRQRLVLRDLLRLVGDRAAAEPLLDREHKTQNAEAEHRFEYTYQDAIVRFASEKEVTEREVYEARARITTRYKTERTAAEKEYLEARQLLTDEYETGKEAAKAEFQEARWTITAVFEGSKSGGERHTKSARQRLSDALERIEGIRQEAKEFLEECRLEREPPRENLTPAPEDPNQDPFDQLKDYLSFAERQLRELRALKLPKYLRGERLLWFFAALWLVAIYPAVYFSHGVLYGFMGCTIGVVALGIGLSAWLYSAARSQVTRVFEPLHRALFQAESLLKRCHEFATGNYHRDLGESKRRYNRELRQASDKFRRARAELKQRRVMGLREALLKYRRRRAELKSWRTTEWTQAAEKYRRIRKEIQKRYESESQAAQERFAREVTEGNRRHEEEWGRLIQFWQDGLARVHAEIAALNAETGRLFPGWTSPVWSDWLPADSVPPAIRIAEYQVSLAQLPGGMPQHERLKMSEPLTYSLPALVSFPDNGSLLIKASDEGRVQAAQALHAVMFRLLTALPPGKVRFLIVDPVGLGENFASFMHLADYDEALVTSRIWTEALRIEQRLADLTEHMENVIQKYLRNQFETIEEYNANAGEVAEPYRVLVVANFPVNFTSEAARRLVSVVKTGRRCGVYTLISVDTKQPLPQGFDLADLEQAGAQLAWQEGKFRWLDPDFEPYALCLDTPPTEELGTRVLRAVGERAKEAKRVEVPFEFIAPTPDRWWTADSRRGISVPLGRAGATKRQHLELGHGTAQHVLIAGKTGSGKSTLLHALISNLALLYSPEEVELYLVDFKKGVEFKTYASHQLPHARVVAIESEREFGLSVLQRLDAELKKRGEKFRAVRAQDLAAYRQANGDAPVPRILLIVDEFQEFFVEDDRIAQDAALLLDRLVRQGRAFGLHVLLGSQTLGGAYTLARSTIDQMAVRIALQCSEADAHLILSEDNSAARLLSRPGEAIYNNANGLVEGNNPFQVVWLGEETREDYLARLRELAGQRGQITSQIVFEGNAPSDVSRNDLLHQLLAAPRWSPGRGGSQAWLGEAVAIKEPTSALFRSQSGANLLILGQQEEAALGMMATTIVSLAAQRPPAGVAPERGSVRFCVLDGSPEDAPYADLFSRLAEAIPHPLRLGSWRDLAALVSEVGAEVQRRQQAKGGDWPELYFLIYGLQRFRDLRRPDDDFSLSAREEELANPARLLGAILRDGPSVGVHSIVWCDTPNNMQRAFDRQALREFELRVLFQMSATDSSNLIDTPLASKLGLHRALFHSEEQGRLEKFRPYGLPPQTWLDWVTEQLRKKCNPP